VVDVADDDDLELAGGGGVVGGRHRRVRGAGGGGNHAWVEEGSRGAGLSAGSEGGVNAVERVGLTLATSQFWIIPFKAFVRFL
jgi:hypothetical protein